MRKGDNDLLLGEVVEVVDEVGCRWSGVAPGMTGQSRHVTKGLAARSAWYRKRRLMD